MTPQQEELVRKTFAQLEPVSEQAAALFYGRLFAIAPEVRPLFGQDMTQQGIKLMQTIGVAVAHLDHLDAVLPSIQALGQRHATYGVQPEHYDTFGAALLWTLEQGLGEAFTPEVKEAWAVVYMTLAGAMKDAAYGPVRPASPPAGS